MKTKNTALLSLMLAFFTMGFVDLVGIASNYVQKDLSLADSQANILPSLVFFWFLIFSVPTGMLMNRIGRKNTVLISILVTALSLIIPIFGSSYPVMLVSFSLLGIGNAIMQTSLNPLVSNVVEEDRLASTLTFGQFVKAIASFMAPYIAMWGATAVIPIAGLEWRVLFPIYAVVAVLASLLVGFSRIEEAPADSRATGFIGCLKLLGNPFVLLCFFGIMCHVGIDVGTNTTAPKLLMERLGFSLDEAAFATSLYFIFRTIGSFTGSYILSRVRAMVFFCISSLMILLAMAGLLFVNLPEAPFFIYLMIALIGYGNSNIFPIIFSQALTHVPENQNEVSGLMIMGLFGGTIFPLLMGFASDWAGTSGAVMVMAAGAAYLVYFTSRIK
ncbi:MAG: MFS transporter [Candidatus Cryptobacteroides sp.]